MESFFFTYIVFTALILKSLNASIDEDCPKPSNVFKSTIIKAQESIARNATLIEKIEDVASASVCYNLCCNYANCNVAVIRFEKVYDEDNLESVKKGCYLFDCKTPSVCSYKAQKDFAVITLDRPVVQPPDAIIDEDQLTTTTHQKLLPNEEKCPVGVPVAMCSYIPCEKATCPGDSSAVCRNSFCGGCKAVFYTQSGEKSNCVLKEQNNEERHNGQATKESHNEQVTKESHNEQELTVSASDEQEEPKEHLLVNYLKSENNKKADNNSSDPYYSSDRRDWEDQPGQEHIVEYPGNDSTNSTPPARIIINDVKLIQSSLISVPLMVALIISLLLLVGLTYHVKCGRRGKPKKVAVDDGDYLINGMYL